MHRSDDAEEIIGEALKLDRLDYLIMAERYLVNRDETSLRSYVAALDNDVQTLLDVAFDLAWSGLRDDAYSLLMASRQEGRWEHPILWYTLSWLASSLGHQRQAKEFAANAEAASPRYCFPSRLEEMIVLEDAIERNPRSARALYYLGNLHYDKLRHEDAIRCWRRAVELDAEFSIPMRNLGIAEFNVLHDPEAADRMYARAFASNPEDARLLYEWDQLKKRTGLVPPAERLHMLSMYPKLVEHRDDLAVEYIALLNQCGRWEEALKRLSERRFSPWEGGEGLVSAQYVQAHRALGRAALSAGRAGEALAHFEAARHYPQNLGEGKHLLAVENDLDYFSGLAAEQLGNAELARSFWHEAAAPLPVEGAYSWFRAQALKKLGDGQGAHEIFLRLSELAETQRNTVPKIDYFATSLPNLLLFDDDLVKRNRVEALLLSALAAHGLGDEAEGFRQLKQVLAEDPNHLFAAEMFDWLSHASETSSEGQGVHSV